MYVNYVYLYLPFSFTPLKNFNDISASSLRRFIINQFGDSGIGIVNKKAITDKAHAIAAINLQSFCEKKLIKNNF